MFLLILVGLVAVLSTSLYLFLDRRFSTWRRKKVPGPPASVSLTLPKMLLGQESMADVAQRVYTEYRDAPIAGSYIFGNALLHIHDPEIIKHVFIKEFQDFHGRGTVAHPEYDPLSGNLFFLSGQRWRNLRVKLAPTFTSGKIKYMFETIRQSSEQLANYLEERVKAGGGRHTEDVRLLVTRLFVDTVASVVFGVESNVVKNPDSEFYRAVLEAVEPSLANALRSLLAIFGRELQHLLRIRAQNKRTANFFTSVVRETVEFREKNGVERPDMLNLLIQLKNKGFVAPDKDDAGNKTADADARSLQKLTMDEVAAQVFIFFIAGFESSSSTTSFTLYEMAKQPHILEKALEEVDRVLEEHDGKITYDAIMSMPYLDKAISETLRKYPPLPFLTREVMVTRKVPLSDVTVDVGTRVIVPVRALHYDPQYWPNPERYDPERFSEEQKNTRPTHAYIPFGDGPRICIAARLGLVQIKTALLTLLSKYSVEPSNEAVEEKVHINPRSFATTPEFALNVTFVPRTRVPRKRASGLAT